MGSAAPPVSLLLPRLPKCPSSSHRVTLTPPSSIHVKLRFTNRSLSCCFAIDGKDEGLPSPTPTAPHPGAAIRVVFTGGGSGGHIYPAIAIAEELKNARPDACILFVGTASGIESTAAPSAGFDYASVPLARLTRPLFHPANLILPFRLLHSVAASWRILRDFRPDIVVGTGGYAAAPVCLTAALSGVKLAIQEQNGIPGLANRVVAPYASKVFLAFNACVKYFPKDKCEVRGNPIRLSLRRYVSKAVARSHFFPKASSKSGDEKAQVVLILGGSLGANAINIAVLNMYYDMLSEHKNRFIIWQTGAAGFNEMESVVKNHRRLLLTPFLHAMDLAYAAADVVVSRAGAMTCTEILTTGKPSIMIPSPNVADDHQTNNAYIMADIAGSKFIEEDDLDSSNLEIAINEVLGDEKLMAEMSERALAAARPDAAAEIARSILSLAGLSSPKASKSETPPNYTDPTICSVPRVVSDLDQIE